MRKILSTLYFLTALVSIVLYPRIHGLQLVQYGLLSIIMMIFGILSLHGLKLSRDELTLAFFTFIFGACSMIGAVFSGGASGILTAIVFLISFIITLTSVKYGLNNQLLKGFFFLCCIQFLVYNYRCRSVLFDNKRTPYLDFNTYYERSRNYWSSSSFFEFNWSFWTALVPPMWIFSRSRMFSYSYNTCLCFI